MEVNPRLGATVRFQHHCGLDIALLAVRLALGASTEDLVAPRWNVGQRYHWLLGDLEGLRVSLRRGELGARGTLRWLGRMFGDLVRANVHLTWDRRDPRPTLEMYRATLSALAGDAWAGLAGRLGRRRP